MNNRVLETMLAGALVIAGAGCNRYDGSRNVRYMAHEAEFAQNLGYHHDYQQGLKLTYDVYKTDLSKVTDPKEKKEREELQKKMKSELENIVTIAHDTSLFSGVFNPAFYNTPLTPENMDTNIEYVCNTLALTPSVVMEHRVRQYISNEAKKERRSNENTACANAWASLATYASAWVIIDKAYGIWLFKHAHNASGGLSASNVTSSGSAIPTTK